MGPFRTIVASAARTATGQSTVQVDPQTASVIALKVALTAHSGTTPTLDLTVEWTDDGGSTFYSADPADAFTQLTTTDKSIVKTFVRKAPGYRIKWTIAGTTPSYTFSVGAARAQRF